ncbi:MAG: glycosyltransferase [Nitrospiraceae bacterium]|nr:glycosyltransferase [Nitrospiraceae bacterium]
MFDVVIPVFNAMHHARACIKSVLHDDTIPLHLYVVNDHSAGYTTEALRQLLSGYDDARYTLIENHENLGYLKSLNRGIAEGSSPYVLCLNSDTFVPPGHLRRLTHAFESDEQIAVATAVSDWANWTRICWRIPQGYNALDFARRVAEVSTGAFPDIHNASGFYFAVRRSVFDSLGLFDEAYGFGYWEETDFCMRVLDAGWRVVVDDGLFVHHHGQGTLDKPSQQKHMNANRRIFMKRWKRAYRKLEKAWKKNNPISYVDPAIFSDRGIVAPALIRGRPSAAAGSQATQFPISREEARRRLAELMDPATSLGEILSTLDRAGDASKSQSTAPPQVLFLVPDLSADAAGLAAIQLVHQLLTEHVDANIVTYGVLDEQALQVCPVAFSPHVYPDAASMLSDFPDCGVLVATDSEMAHAAVLLRQLRPHLKLFHWIQDQSGCEDEQTHRACRLIADRVVGSDWMARELAGFGGTTHVVPPGVNLDFFHDLRCLRAPHVIAWVGADTSSGDFEDVCRVYEALHRLCPGIELALCGQGYETRALPFPVKDHGRVTRLDQLATALNEATFFLGLGSTSPIARTALAAMACGTAAVLSRQQSITGFAKHEHNCLLFEPSDCDGAVEQLHRIIEDSWLRQRLIDNAHQTASAHTAVQQTRKMADLLQQQDT